MAVGAHPDDIELAAGGLVATWTAAGAHVELVCLTSGQLGGEAAVREAEARRSAELLGAAAVHFMGQVDGRLEPSVELRRRLAALIRQVRPDAVAGHDPWRRWLLHPDHRAAGLLTVDAAVVAREPRLDLGVPAHRAHTVLLWGSDEPDEVVDVAPVMARKLAAIAAHASQVPSAEETARRVLTWAAAVGAPYGVDAAEAFHTLDLRGR
jgi:LmbE family N-acetylglucosaminyl deacetylase